MIELAPMLKHKLEYDEAWLYTATLTHNNKHDWRLPTLNEYTNHEHLVGWFNDRDSRGVQPVRDKL